MRLFISVDVPPWIKRAVYGAQRELALEGVNVVDTANMHITLKFLGEVNPKKFQKIEQQLRTIEHPVFEAVIKGAGAFPNEEYVRVVWAGCKTRELAALADKVNKALPEFPAEPFVGHFTLARVKKKVPLRAFFNKYREWRFGDFEAKNFYLIGSELTTGGPKYTILAEFPLKGAEKNEQE